ncbi:hypothetical protein F638_1440 [Pseudomonas sp. LAIL14HWK12:I2]|jgi:hypothetical protein|nr:hypothetical protein F638_1440 [Pseudomonas sp. LAIL14HWK12:I2]
MSKGSFLRASLSWIIRDSAGSKTIEVFMKDAAVLL